MDTRRERARGRLAGIDRQRQARRSARAGVWVLRVSLGVALLLYGLSFLAPPPVAPADVAYDSPTSVAYDVAQNLRTATYEMHLEAARIDGGGGAEPIVERTLTVDNRARLYREDVRTGELLANRSIDPRRAYGTVTTGYRRLPTGMGSADGGANASGSWERADDARYHPSRNAFAAVDALNGTAASVVSADGDAYVLRVEDDAAVAETVELPDHDQTDAEDWTATLTFHVDRDSDRLTRAEYRYRAPATDERVRATYRFEYGLGADVDRPLATYPPGSEVLARLDHGLRTVNSLLGGGG